MHTRFMKLDANSMLVHSTSCRLLHFAVPRYQLPRAHCRGKMDSKGPAILGAGLSAPRNAVGRPNVAWRLGPPVLPTACDACQGRRSHSQAPHSLLHGGGRRLLCQHGGGGRGGRLHHFRRRDVLRTRGRGLPPRRTPIQRPYSPPPATRRERGIARDAASVRGVGGRRRAHRA